MWVLSVTSLSHRRDTLPSSITMRAPGMELGRGPSTEAFQGSVRPAFNLTMVHGNKTDAKTSLNWRCMEVVMGIRLEVVESLLENQSKLKLILSR